jgi:hypothetical protein
MRQIVAVFAVFVTLTAAGCAHGQPAPSPQPAVTLTCSAPASCTAQGAPSCAYVFSRATCTGSTQGTCAVTFTPLNLSTPAATCAYTDNTPPTGINVSYVASTVQNGLTGNASTPSNNSVPLAVPVYPGTPGGPTATATAALAPPLLPGKKPAPVMAGTSNAMGLTARVEPWK